MNHQYRNEKKQTELTHYVCAEVLKEGSRKLFNEEAELPELKDISAGVRDAEDPRVAYIFFDFFLPAVVGKKKYKNRVAYEPVSKIATVSDEALAMLLLENSWEKWEDELDKETTDPSKLKPTKWTSMKSQGKRYCGWNQDGMIRFNELCDIVKKDRKKDQMKEKDERVEYQYCKKKRKAADDKKRKSNNNDGENAPSKKVQVYTDGWSDDE